MSDTRTVQELRAEHDARMAKPEVLAIDYHRNGISGDGFYVALVRDPDVDQRVLCVIVPSWAVEAQEKADRTAGRSAAATCPSGGVPCYAIDPALAAGPWTKPGTIEFGTNSWRGDHYFDLVCEAARARS